MLESYLIPLVVTVSLAVVNDYRNWRIPNDLVAIGLIQGFVVSAVVRGLYEGLTSSVRGFLAPVVILYVLFLIRALGAGDIKLLAVAGTFVGSDIYRVMIYSFLAGGVISIIYLLKEFILFILSFTNRKKLADRTESLSNMSGGSLSNRSIGETSRKKRRVHFSAAILGGIMCYMADIGWG